MMKNRPPLTSPDGSSNRNTPERCPRPLYSRDSIEEHQEIPQDDQYKEEPEDLSVRGDHPCKEEEIPPETSTDTRDTQRDVKEEEEEKRVRVKEESEEMYVRNDKMCVRGKVPCVEVEAPPQITRAVKRKRKEHSRELRDEVIELHTAGRGYKAISKGLDVPVYTVRSIIKKWKVHQTTETLPRKGRPSKLSEQTRRRLVREATERPSVTLEELQSSVVQTGVKVHKTTISRALNKTGLLLSKKHGFMIAVEALANCSQVV